MRTFILLAVTLGLLAPLRAEEGKNEIDAAALAVLEKADAITVYSLEPSRRSKEQLENAKDKELFYNWEVLGKTELKTAEERKKMAPTLKGTLQTKDFMSANCFNPRHAIRATQDKKTVDVIICFECSNAYYWGPEETAKLGAYTHESRKMLYVNDKAREALNKILTDAGVKLAPAAKKE